MIAENELEFLDTELDEIGAGIELRRVAVQIPSCIEIGLHASKKGDFIVARQMFRTAIKHLTNNQESQSRLISLITNIADTYLNERRYDLAKQWYAKALKRNEFLPNKNNLQCASIIARMTAINVLQCDMKEFKKDFETVQRMYLLSVEADVSLLLNSLIDLSWALCLQRLTDEARTVNQLISQIKKLDDGMALEITSA